MSRVMLETCRGCIICIFLRLRDISSRNTPHPGDPSGGVIYLQIVLSPNEAVYEIIRKNIVEPGRPQMTIERMRIACRIPKATNTHSEYVMFTAIPQQKWLLGSTSFLRYTYIACLVTISALCT
jgi:hypothetical protein